jgi:DNA-binding winged helix-turn-helix (wHTH) protein
VSKENRHALLQWVFDCFRLDPDHACLWRDAEILTLPPKAFGLLHYFVQHPDRVLPKDELLNAVWPGTAVTDAVVRVKAWGPCS